MCFFLGIFLCVFPFLPVCRPPFQLEVFLDVWWSVCPLMALGLGLRARVSDSGTRLHPCGSPPGSVSPPFLMGVGFGFPSSPFVGRGPVSLLYMCPSIPETKASCSHRLSPAAGFCLHLPVIVFVLEGSALKHPLSPGGTRGEWGHL